MHGGTRIVAVDALAAQSGVCPGQPLTHARAISPDLEAIPAEPEKDQALLESLARWCTRYTPWARADGNDGLLADVSGCAHLFGGEQALLDDLTARLSADGFSVRGALAGTVGAAWGLARFSSSKLPIIKADAAAHEDAMAPLPMAALRIGGAEIEGLARMGLRRVDDIYDVARAPLSKRFGRTVLDRLDAALGRIDEAVDPEAPHAPLLARLAFADPIGTIEDIQASLSLLLADICGSLERRALGARRLVLSAHRVDGHIAQVAVGTGRPVRDPHRLARLFEEKIPTIEAGFGIDCLTLWASMADTMDGTQTDLEVSSSADKDGLDDLIDRLGAKLGPNYVRRIVLAARHIPEQATTLKPAIATQTLKSESDTLDHQSSQPRPVRLLAWPQPIDVIAPVPDHPPIAFRWQGRTRRVHAAEGPERIGPEWWLLAPTQQANTDAHTSVPRDYYRIEDEDGGRFWVYREGAYRPDHPARWYLHGMFA